MNHLTCTACHQPVAYGEAVMRSRSFEQFAWHPACYDIEHAEHVAA